MTNSTDTLQLDRYYRTVALKDGSVLHLRPILPDDEDRLMAFFLRLSGRTITFAIIMYSPIFPGRRLTSIR